MVKSGMGPSYSSLVRGLKWLMGFRAVFGTVLIASTAFFCLSQGLPNTIQPFISLYIIAGSMLIFSLVCIPVLSLDISKVAVAYAQLVIDSFLVTGIIFITGSFVSIFLFLYLVVIIGASMLLLRKGAMAIAAVCSIQYGILIDLEYYGVICPFGDYGSLSSSVEWTHVIFRIAVIIVACFSVAVLSGILALQSKRANTQLKTMEGHLRRVERMAAMGELAAGMAHEIKNPLASLSGSIQMLNERTDPGSPDYRLMQIVLRETSRLSSLVSDFLLFAKPHTANARAIRLDLIIGETVDLFRQDPLCTGAIQIDVQVQEPVWIHMDPGHLRQILWNLLKNAAESIEEDDGIITLKLRPIGADQVQLTIIDNGSGIDPETIDSVFDPFFTTKSNGTGLGLSIIHRLMDTYRGMIDLDSKPGVGTVFTLVFKNVNPQQNLDTNS